MNIQFAGFRTPGGGVRVYRSSKDGGHLLACELGCPFPDNLPYGWGADPAPSRRKLAWAMIRAATGSVVIAEAFSPAFADNLGEAEVDFWATDADSVRAFVLSEIETALVDQFAYEAHGGGNGHE
jgi:hypothetical protein